MNTPDQSTTSGLSRRRLLGRAALIAGGASLAAVLAACGSDDSGSASTSSGTVADEPLAGEIVMMNYPGWMGEGEVAAFEKANPGVTVRQVEGLTSGNAAALTQIRQNIGTYDMTLANLAVSGLLQEAGLAQAIDPARVPNLSRMPANVRDKYPLGIPTDYGKVGFAYRSDLIPEKPTSFADLWELAPKYSRKVVFVNFDVDVIGSALLYKGFDVNSTDPGELEQARDALIDIKPDLLAFLGTDVMKPLVQGSAVLTLGYDYDVALAQRQNRNIVWVPPTEGTPAYFDGWTALKDTDMLPEVEAFMDFHLQPEIYADFINTIGGSYFMPEAEPFIDPAIKDNPALRYDPEVIERAAWQEYLGAEGTELWARTWEEVKAA